MKILRYWYFLPVIFLFSCLEEFEDTDRIAKSTLKPAIEFPVANSTFTISEFLEKGASVGFVEQQGTNLVLIYEDELLAQDATSLFSIPDQNQQSVNFTAPEFPFSIPGSTITVTRNQTFTLSTNGEQLDSLYFKSGTALVSIQSDIQADILLQLRFPTIRKGNTPLELEFSYDYPGSGPGNWNLSNTVVDIGGAIADLTDGGTTTNTVPYEITVSVTDQGQALSASQEIDFSFQLMDLAFRAIFGDLGTQPFNSRKDTIHLDLFTNTVSGSFEPADPKLVFTLTNEFGIPVAVDISPVGIYTEKSESITLSGPAASAPLNPYIISAPSLNEIGQAKTSTIELNSTNSNLATMMSDIPKYLFYEFQGELNPGTGPFENFAIDTCKVNVHIRAEIPLFGKAANLIITREFDFEWIDEEDLEGITITQYTENGFPLTVQAQAYFFNNDGDLLDSLYKADRSVINSAPVDANGESSGVTTLEKEIQLTATQLQNLQQATRLQLVVVINTAQGGTVPVHIKTDDELLIRLGLKGRFEYTIN